MAKKRTTAKKRVTRKPPAHTATWEFRRHHQYVGHPGGIVMVLGGLFLYAQNNKKQAALLQSLIQTIATLPTPAPTALPAESAGDSRPRQA